MSEPHIFQTEKEMIDYIKNEARKSRYDAEIIAFVNPDDERTIRIIKNDYSFKRLTILLSSLIPLGRFQPFIIT